MERSYIGAITSDAFPLHILILLMVHRSLQHLFTITCLQVRMMWVTDANGCVLNTTATVNKPGGPTAIAVTPADATCGTDNGSVTMGAVTGGTAPYTYSVDGSAFTTTTFTTILAGSWYSCE